MAVSQTHTPQEVMTHQLDGARLKIIRAQEHIDSLKAEIGMYLKEKSYNVSTNKNADATFSTTIKTTIPPPLRLSTIIGDCLTNARGALDYTMFQLASICFVPPLDVTRRSDLRLTSFPLFSEIDTAPDSFYMNRFNALKNRMTGIPGAANAIDRIKGVQPYNTGQFPLWWLHELVNFDKHRMPLLTIGPIDTFTASFPAGASFSIDSNGSVFSDGFVMAGSVTIGARYLTTESVTLHSDAMHVDTQATIYVTLQDVTMPREPVERTLEQIVERVADAIPRFDEFFS